jgi:outer membrane receptor protein involved in Fe transport
VRRAYNLRVPSDRHRSGELNFSGSRTSQAFFDPTTGNVITGDIREQGTNIAAGTGGLGLATFLLGDVTGFSRFVSSNTDARERQWRHFYYGQDTWRVTPKLTVNYGLRVDVINPQTLNEPGNGGFLDIDTGEILVAGVGNVDINGNIDKAVSRNNLINFIVVDDETTLTAETQSERRPRRERRKICVASVHSAPLR